MSEPPAQAFDEMLLLKRGGQVIYNGPLGFQSRAMVGYFSAIAGVKPISDTANPATWMLDISSISAEQRLDADLATVYAKSALARCAAVGGACHASQLERMAHCGSGEPLPACAAKRSMWLGGTCRMPPSRTGRFSWLRDHLSIGQGPSL